MKEKYKKNGLTEKTKEETTTKDAQPFLSYADVFHYVFFK